MEEEYEYFKQWFVNNEIRFHLAHMNEVEVAYSAFRAGIEYIEDLLSLGAEDEDDEENNT